VPPIRLFDAQRLQAPHAAAIHGAIDSVLASGRYVLGAAVAAFERDFAAYCGVGHAIGVGNGSDALELALRALGIGGGDRVVTVANAGGYASGAIRACGAQPDYVDIDAGTLLVDVQALESRLVARPAAVIVTHLYGRLAPIDAIVDRCNAFGVPLVEDCAQAHGAMRRGRRAGSFGAIGCFSFYPTKNLGALGDGGALVTDDAELAERIRALRQYGWREKYRVELAGGRNSRLDELQAAVLCVKLPTLDADNALRRDIARRYLTAIQHDEIVIPAGRGGADDVAHLFVLRCARRDQLRAHLARCGIDTDVHYPLPDHCQPAWREAIALSLPHTEATASEVLSVPCHSALSDAEVVKVIEAINDFR
jgi:dTDP-3-amino-2,3,6-trideoxy-4-keto-D-glucose/dTDP-3-amino-3,4,6-trideoxy-alpha-D-glucose/dTDP-2,6-dideoxy-D-kanosamine transaminase